MKPYIELGMKPKKLLKNRQLPLIHGNDANGIFSDDECIRKFMSDMMNHFLERYGAKEVESWYFELWKKELEENFFTIRIYQIVKICCGKHFHIFDVTAKALRLLLPGIRLGSGGFFPAPWQWNAFRK